MTHVYICQNHNLKSRYITSPLLPKDPLLCLPPAPQLLIWSLSRDKFELFQFYITGTVQYTVIYVWLFSLCFCDSPMLLHISEVCIFLLPSKDVPYYDYSFTCWIFSSFGYYDQHCDKHICINLLFSFLLGKYLGVECHGRMGGA